MSDSSDGYLLERVTGYIAQRLESVIPHSTEEYFTVILDRAVRASEVGDYGIGAALLLRADGVEVVTLGWSTMVTGHNPLGHAEIGAISQMKRFLSAIRANRAQQHVGRWGDLRSVLSSSDRIFLRPAAADRPAVELFSSLEPCPMCTVAIINAGIDRVLIALPDEPAGALGPGRLDKLPPLWPSLARAQGLEVKFAVSQLIQKSDTYLPPELVSLLHDAFWTTKEAVDSRLVDGVLFDRDVFSKLHTLMDQSG
jgi:tRNA(Arg) A34 adenosine deaminase TadA